MGYLDFISTIDAIVMGRNTFKTVLSFGMPWPYTKPVFVLSHTRKSTPEGLKGEIFIMSDDLDTVLEQIHNKGYHHLYIDGGKTIQSFLEKDLIDEIIISTIPVILGDGVSLFSHGSRMLTFDLVGSSVYLNQINQCHYKRKKEIKKSGN